MICAGGNKFKLKKNSVRVVRVVNLSSSQSKTRCISLKSLSTNQIAGFAHLHEQNGVRRANFSSTNQKAGFGSRDSICIHVVSGN